MTIRFLINFSFHITSTSSLFHNHPTCPFQGIHCDFNLFDTSLGKVQEQVRLLYHHGSSPFFDPNPHSASILYHVQFNVMNSYGPKYLRINCEKICNSIPAASFLMKVIDWLQDRCPLAGKNSRLSYRFSCVTDFLKFMNNNFSSVYIGTIHRKGVAECHVARSSTRCHS